MRAVTAESYAKRIRLLSRLVDVENPGRVKAVICAYPASEARKQLLTNAYDYYCQFKNYVWNKPRFVREQVPIFLPLESLADSIASFNRYSFSPDQLKAILDGILKKVRTQMNK